MVIVDRDLCTGCGTCIPYCSVKAISMGDSFAQIDSRKCTDCYVCVRNKVCRVEAISKGPLETFYEQYRHLLSDPTETTAATGVPGRGTEEAKTNDVSGRVRSGEIGFAIDMGRPGMGVRMSDVEKVARAVTAAGLVLEPGHVSPLGKVLADLGTGEMQPGARDLFVLSVIIEGKCPEARAKGVLQALQQVSGEIESVFSLGLIMRPDREGDFSGLKILDELGIPRPHRGKVNIGLGRPLAEP
ncbi:MAG: 4Fe-4S dicluster domain-containing protein [Bacillota bacterium]|nr:4Fe-4S dicluster domain-containing protein [Bacillota bacterium]